MASKKLIVVDKVALAGLAKVVYVAKDRVAGLAKGPSLALDQIDLAFDLSYLGVGSVTGGFVVPSGGCGAPVGGVDTTFTVNNDGVTHRHCSCFPVCVHKAIGGGTGAKLVCKTGIPTACPGSGSTTTSTTMIVTTTLSSSSSTITTSTAPSCSDGITKGDETDVDCGGSCPACALGSSCGASADCLSDYCSGGFGACANDGFVISANTIGDGPDFGLSHERPDGPVTACTPGASECCVTVDRPGGTIDITEVGGDPRIFVSVTGFSSCSAAGDFCANNPVCNAPAAISRCVIGRLSCPSALGSASHTVDIACLE